MEEKLPKHIAWLLKEGFSGIEEEVQLIQTHISYVFLVGDYVYKWKKCVDHGFLNFSTLQKRKYYCQQEVALNRRLCPEIYLGLVRLTLTETGYELDGQGEVVEYGVKMRRMPENRMMCNVIGEGGLKKVHLEKIVSQLIPFYKNADGGTEVRKYGDKKYIAQNVMENFHQTERFAGGDLLPLSRFENVKKYAIACLEDGERFRRRVVVGKIHDCHGDLHSANICLTDNVHIFDCIEFNSRLRFTDVAADIAFLAMDLDFHNLEDLSKYFVQNFTKHSGDTTLQDVLTFYKCYRAVVRAKVSFLIFEDKNVESKSRRKSGEMAANYYKLAEQYCAKDDV